MSQDEKEKKNIPETLMAEWTYITDVWCPIATLHDPLLEPKYRLELEKELRENIRLENRKKKKEARRARRRAKRKERHRAKDRT